MTTIAITVTIGRNVGDTPMRRRTWELFQHDVKIAITRAISLYPESVTIVPVNTFLGMGEWAGVLEDSAMISAVSDVLSPRAVAGFLSRELPNLARQYGQDAIAYSVAPSLLAERN